MPQHKYKVSVHARFGVIWQKLLDKIEHPQKYVIEIRHVEILERKPDHIVRRVQFENTSWQELKELIIINEKAGTIVYRLVDHPYFTGDTTNICRTTNDAHISELEYTIDWKLKDPNGIESTEIKDDARQALELSAREMKRASEEAESVH
ncbi:unnamed protein product, partial [Rotaria sordida]